MIARIMGEGQFELPDSAEPVLDALGSKLLRAIEDEDEKAYRETLDELLVAIGLMAGPPLAGPPRPSELVLPGPGTTAKEIRELLALELVG
jgi:hypothetical protein